jgi:hypothetical protein
MGGQRSTDLANDLCLVKESSYCLGKLECHVAQSFSCAGTAPLAHQDSTAHQHGEVGDLEAFLEGPSGERIHITLAISISCFWFKQGSSLGFCSG